MIETIGLTIDTYAVGYPMVLSFVWILGALVSRMKESPKTNEAVEQPKVSIVVSAYNEEELIHVVLESLREVEYSNLEVMIVDDKSTDLTLSKLFEIKEKYPDWDALKIIEQPENQGKAAALNRALSLITGEYMLVLDADSYLDSQAVKHLLKELRSRPNAGAVTGRPVVRNRSTLLGKLQTMEYLSVIDAIKRTQSYLFGTIMTVSGVIVMYRVQALKDIGGFDAEIMTEDIDITWRLYRKNWDVLYNTDALSYILVPEKVFSLLKQRRRWAIGGLEVLIKNVKPVITNGHARHRLLLLEMIASHIWSWFFLISLFRFTVLSTLTREIRLPGQILVVFLMISFILFFIGIVNDKQVSFLNTADKLVLPVYLLVYWMVNLISSLSAEFIIMFGKTNKGRWSSPDRGV